MVRRAPVVHQPVVVAAGPKHTRPAPPLYTMGEGFSPDWIGPSRDQRVEVDGLRNGWVGPRSRDDPCASAFHRGTDCPASRRCSPPFSCLRSRSPAGAEAGTGQPHQYELLREDGSCVNHRRPGTATGHATGQPGGGRLGVADIRRGMLPVRNDPRADHPGQPSPPERELRSQFPGRYPARPAIVHGERRGGADIGRGASDFPGGDFRRRCSPRGMPGTRHHRRRRSHASTGWVTGPRAR